MPTGKITKRSVDALLCEGRDTFLWDSDLRGFGVKATPAGAKIYLIQYRMAGRATRTRRWTIGRHGTWTPASARDQAEELLRIVATGIDPRVQAKEREEATREREAEHQRLEFAKYAERFLAEYGKRRWRPRTYKAAASNIRRWVVPALKAKSLPAINRRDVTQLFDGLPASSPALARNVFALVRKLFTWAVERGDIERSPFERMKSPASVAPRDRVLKDDELLIVAACADRLGAPFGVFIRMLILTGQRRDEVSGMQWGELDRRQREWIIPTLRTKNSKVHHVPLNRIAMFELDQLADGSRWPRSGLVFTTTGDSQISGYSKAKARLDQQIERVAGEQLAPWRFHDLRRTFATNMQQLGVRFEVTEALLNHVSGAKSGVAGVYQRHDWAAEKREAMNRWAEKLSDMLADPTVMERHLSPVDTM